MTLRDFMAETFTNAMMVAGASQRHRVAKAFTEWCAWIAAPELRASKLVLSH